MCCLCVFVCVCVRERERELSVYLSVSVSLSLSLSPTRYFLSPLFPSSLYIFFFFVPFFILPFPSPSLFPPLSHIDWTTGVQASDGFRKKINAKKLLEKTDEFDTEIWHHVSMHLDNANKLDLSVSTTFGGERDSYNG
jgi:hypothetical protein